jgi:ABC-type phosphate/phosphonate transport system substrate-binding protein/outer membrane protein assembly factor BamB
MRVLFTLALGVSFWLPAAAKDIPQSDQDGQSLSMVVMDPLAEPLSCPCVQGYAQRKYEKLADYLAAQLGKPVHVTFAESFEKALAKETCKTIDIAIGKDSVVRHDAKTAKIKMTPTARLTGKDGLTTQHGLIVVRSSDPAKEFEDLRGYRILFGTKDCDEKFAAPRYALANAGVELPDEAASETTVSCSDGACKIIEWGDSQRAAAVISSYAAPLLEGCGTVKKGDLRVIGETQPVPFITVFVADRVDRSVRDSIHGALLSVSQHAELKDALETLNGFVDIDDDYRSLRDAILNSGASTRQSTKPSDASPKSESRARESTGSVGWPQWRGPNRDGHVSFLPNKLPDKPAIIWRQPLRAAGLGGIAATDDFVIIGDRDVTNKFDDFRCYSAKDGKVVWSVQYPAMGELDYGNMPRATPLIHENKAFLLGAFGDLTCVELDTGQMVWQLNIVSLFDGEKELVWGTCSSPLIVDDKLIVNPGGPEASLVALEPNTGEVIWQAPGGRHAYASFIIGTFGGVRQLVGYDQKTLGGWEIATGNRLWTLKPKHEGDFNVSTPVAANGKLIVTTENNATRIYMFDSEGRIVEMPDAINKDLVPDISTPIVVGSRLFCVNDHMYCLDLHRGLKPLWVGDDEAFGDSAPLIASDDRLLMLGLGGELLLIDPSQSSLRVISRLSLFDDSRSKRTQLLSYPALVGSRLYVRGENELLCVSLIPGT